MNHPAVNSRNFNNSSLLLRAFGSPSHAKRNRPARAREPPSARRPSRSPSKRRSQSKIRPGNFGSHIHLVDADSAAPLMSCLPRIMSNVSLMVKMLVPPWKGGNRDLPATNMVLAPPFGSMAGHMAWGHHYLLQPPSVPKMQAERRAGRLKNEEVNDYSQGRAIYSKSYTGKCKTSP